MWNYDRRPPLPAARYQLPDGLNLSASFSRGGGGASSVSPNRVGQTAGLAMTSPTRSIALAGGPSRSQFPQLQSLTLWNNQLTGPLPSEWGQGPASSGSACPTTN